jgi:hypothetical protein
VMLTDEERAATSVNVERRRALEAARQEGAEGGSVPEMWAVEVTPPCRVCRDAKNVLCYDPKDHSAAICPDCCDKVKEHPDGETGHRWEYDRYERAHACGYCGIFRRDTNYDHSEDYEP